jgi:hypothetical protein
MKTLQEKLENLNKLSSKLSKKYEKLEEKQAKLRKKAERLNEQAMLIDAAYQLLNPLQQRTDRLALRERMTNTEVSIQRIEQQQPKVESDHVESAPKIERRGRPLGSKNKKTLVKERLLQAAAEQATSEQTDPDNETIEVSEIKPKKMGRPPGAKNKPKQKKRGRPPGAKNKRRKVLLLPR